jgi:hypothetical protein
MSERRLLLGLLCSAVLLAGCGGSSTPPPAAPSLTVADTVTIDLNVLTPSGTRGAGVNAPVVGIVTRVSGACPDLSFVLSGVTIHVTGRTRIEGGTCADIQEGMRAGALGAPRADGSVDAARLRVGSPPPAPVAGLVESLSGSCPTLTFVLDRVTIRTSADTVFEGGTCGDLREGVRAGVIGRRTGERTLDAEHVRMAARPPQPPQDPRPPQPPGDQATVGGMVRSVSGTCPTLTFAIDRITVHVSARTTFEGGSCADVKVDVRAGAAGTKRSDGSIDATRVRLAPR